MTGSATQKTVFYDSQNKVNSHVAPSQLSFLFLPAYAAYSRLLPCKNDPHQEKNFQTWFCSGSIPRWGNQGVVVLDDILTSY